MGAGRVVRLSEPGDGNGAASQGPLPCEVGGYVPDGYFQRQRSDQWSICTSTTSREEVDLMATLKWKEQQDASPTGERKEDEC